MSMCLTSQAISEMDRNLRDRIGLFGQIVEQYAMLEKENREESREIREMLKMEVLMPSTYFDKEGKTIEVVAKDGVVSIGLSILAMRKYNIAIPIKPGLNWTKQSFFHMLELCSVGTYKSHEYDQWYIDQYMGEFKVEQIIPSRLYDLYSHRILKLKESEHDEAVQFVLSDIVNYSKETLECFLYDALEKRESNSDHSKENITTILRYSKEMSERITVI